MREDTGDGCGPDGTIGKDGYPLAEGHREAAARYNGNNSFQALPGTLEVIVL